MLFKGLQSLVGLILVSAQLAYAASPGASLPSRWSKLEPVLKARLTQNKPKMKLSQAEVAAFIQFLKKQQAPLPQLESLETVLPKTTVELWRAIQERGLSFEEAEKMAAYLLFFVKQAEFKNKAAFDENTSHLIGREWSEIDYSGENLNGQTQRRHYLPYGILDFKTAAHLKLFFKVEARLPYFNKSYRPKGLRTP
jgi:hypothetical protein